MPGNIHQIAIQRVLSDFPQARTIGFNMAVNDALDLEGDATYTAGLIPDAYLIDAERKTVVAYEIEDGHITRNEKMERYADLWWAVDNSGWHLGLVFVDRWGNYAHAMDVGDFALELVVHQARQSGNPADPEWTRVAEAFRERNAV